MLNSLSFIALMNPIALFVLCVIVIGTLGLLSVPILIANPSSQPSQVLNGIRCYLFQMLGIVLVITAAVPVLAELFALFPIGSSPANANIISMEQLTGPILLFAVGCWLIIHFHNEARKVDAKVKAMLDALFSTTFQLIGLTILLGSGLALGISFVVFGAVSDWGFLVVLFLLGMLLEIIFMSRAGAAKNGGFLTKMTRPRRK